MENTQSKSNQVEQNTKVGNILLPEGKDFIISHSKESYDHTAYITHRSPRKIGSSQVPLIVTNTIDTRTLINLRVEELDEQYFIINDTKSYDKPSRFCVANEEIGHAIIKDIINGVTKKEKEEKEEDNLGLSDQHWRFNKIADKFGPLISAVCGILLTLSACFWLFVK